jgi:hypothetical protein
MKGTNIKTVIFILMVGGACILSSCHKTDTSSTSFKKPENGQGNGKQKNSKIASNSFNPGNPKQSDPNESKTKLLDPNATNAKPQKLNTSGSNARPGNSKSTISRPGKMKKAPKRKKNKRFMSLRTTDYNLPSLA